MERGVDPVHTAGRALGCEQALGVPERALNGVGGDLEDRRRHDCGPSGLQKVHGDETHMLAAHFPDSFSSALGVMAHLHVVGHLREFDVRVHLGLHVEHAEVVTKAVGPVEEAEGMLGQKFACRKMAAAFEEPDRDSA